MSDSEQPKKSTNERECSDVTQDWNIADGDGVDQPSGVEGDSGIMYRAERPPKRGRRGDRDGLGGP